MKDNQTSDKVIIGKVRGYRNADCCAICQHKKIAYMSNGVLFDTLCKITTLRTSEKAVCDSFKSKEIL